MIADALKKGLLLEEMDRYPNKPFPVKKDVAQHTNAVSLSGIFLAEWEERKFGNKVNWETLFKSLALHDLAECVTIDLPPHVKNFDREFFDKIEKAIVEKMLIPDFPKSWQQEYKNYILDPKKDTIEGRIVEAADRLSAIEELTKMLNFVNSEREIYRKIISIIQKTLRQLMKVDLDSCRYFLKYSLRDWDIEDIYPEDFKEYLNNIEFSNIHFENKLSIK